MVVTRIVHAPFLTLVTYLPDKEIWRLRLNWIFFLITPLVTGMAVNELVSYHQFVTNPSMEALMEVNDTLEVIQCAYTYYAAACIMSVTVHRSIFNCMAWHGYV